MGLGVFTRAELGFCTTNNMKAWLHVMQGLLLAYVRPPRWPTFVYPDGFHFLGSTTLPHPYGQLFGQRHSWNRLFETDVSPKRQKSQAHIGAQPPYVHTDRRLPLRPSLSGSLFPCRFLLLALPRVPRDRRRQRVVCGAWLATAGYPGRYQTLEASCCLSSASRTRTPSRRLSTGQERSGAQVSLRARG